MGEYFPFVFEAVANRVVVGIVVANAVGIGIGVRGRRRAWIGTPPVVVCGVVVVAVVVRVVVVPVVVGIVVGRWGARRGA